MIIRQRLRFAGDHLDAVLRIDDDRRRFDGGQCANRASDEIRQTGRVDDVNAAIAGVEVHDGGVQRVLVGLLERLEVTHCGTSFDAARGRDRAGSLQQCFRERGLACATMSDERYRADHFRGELRHASSSYAMHLAQIRRSARNGAGRNSTGFGPV
jgi:hypothetical protein